jgi:hypothetical protein
MWGYTRYTEVGQPFHFLEKYMNKSITLTLALLVALSQTAFAAPVAESSRAPNEAAAFTTCGAELTIGPDGSGVLVPAKCRPQPEQTQAEAAKDCGAELTIGSDGSGVLVPAKCDADPVAQSWTVAAPWDEQPWTAASPWDANGDLLVPAQAAVQTDCGAELTIGADGSGVLVPVKCNTTLVDNAKAAGPRDCGAELTIGADGSGVLVARKCELASSEQQT